MSWRKNEATAAKRECLLIISNNDGYPSNPGIDFIATGSVFVVGVNAPDADLATGTCTNVRRPLAYSDLTFTTDHTTDTLTSAGHELQTGDGPVRLLTSNTLPTGLALATDYWIIKSSVDDYQLAASLADAYSGTPVTFSSNGTGTHTLDLTGVGTERGVPGHFIYRAPQAELNHDAPFTHIIVDDIDHNRRSGAGGHTQVDMVSEASDLADIVIEAGLTLADAIRIILRTHAANFSDSGSVRTFRDIADTKNSHHGTLTSSGRSNSTIDDAT
jgi:hypothetical protein